MNFKLLKILLIPVFIGTSQVASALALLSDFQVKSEIEAVIQASVFPTQIDALTTLTSLQTFGVRGLQYNYTLGMKISDMGGDTQVEIAKNTIINMVKNGFCSNPAMVWYKTNFVELKYVYDDSTNSRIFEFRINPNDC
jgi:hypothetical protein